MDISKLDDDVLDALRNRGHSDGEISRMAPTEVFSEFCEWWGMHGWADTFLRVLKNAQDANMSDHHIEVDGEYLKDFPQSKPHV